MLFLTLALNAHAMDADRYNNGLKWMNTPYKHLGKNTTCFACHYQAEPDTFFWKPSLQEICKSAINLGPDELQQQLLMPFSDRLTLDHQGIALSDTAITDIHYFLTYTQPANLPPHHRTPPFPWAIVVIGTLLITWVDMWLIPFIKPRFISKIGLVVALLSGGHLLGKELSGFGLQQNYAPVQPIKFSHKVHSGQNNIACFYCHAESRHGAKAGIPSTNMCLNCHNVITEGNNSGEYYLKQLQAAHLNHQPIEWIKVHNLPDHVHFNHARHVKNGQLNCTECHGQMDQMNRVKQIESLSMKWCLDCHQQSQTNSTNQLVGETGGYDCMQCHY